jgi:hypothetical protein
LRSCRAAEHQYQTECRNKERKTLRTLHVDGLAFLLKMRPEALSCSGMRKPEMPITAPSMTCAEKKLGPELQGTAKGRVIPKVRTSVPTLCVAIFGQSSGPPRFLGKAGWQLASSCEMTKRKIVSIDSATDCEVCHMRGTQSCSIDSRSHAQAEKRLCIFALQFQTHPGTA